MGRGEQSSAVQIKQVQKIKTGSSFQCSKQIIYAFTISSFHGTDQSMRNGKALQLIEMITLSALEGIVSNDQIGADSA